MLREGGKDELEMIDHPPDHGETRAAPTSPSTGVNEDDELHDQSISLGEVISMSELIAEVVHQVNNPLSNMRLATEVLMEEMEEILPGDSPEKEFCVRKLANIVGEVDRARAVIRELGNLARRKTPAVESLNLKWLVERAVRSRGGQVDPEIEFALEISDTIQVRGDDDLLNTVLANLVSETASSLGGEGQVALHARRARDGAVEITVTASGMHQPAEDRDRMLDPESFPDRAVKRIGLRLAITSEIVKSLGGEIWAERMRGKGKTFRMRLPAPESRE